MINYFPVSAIFDTGFEIVVSGTGTSAGKEKSCTRKVTGTGNGAGSLFWHHIRLLILSSTGISTGNGAPGPYEVTPPRCVPTLNY
jgi:hypothetical protein